MRTPIGDEGGMGLVEVLIAMTIMTVGVMALVAGLGTGFRAIDRASKGSTAGTLVDQQMEAFRRGSWSAVTSIPGAPKTGADGRTYWIESAVDLRCPDETAPTGTPPSCTLSDGVVSRPLKRATVRVREGSSTGDVLITQASTFDQSTG